MQDISLASWQLKQTVGETEVLYKFHRSANLKAGQHVTVSLNCNFQYLWYWIV